MCRRQVPDDVTVGDQIKSAWSQPFRPTKNDAGETGAAQDGDEAQS